MQADNQSARVTAIKTLNDLGDGLDVTIFDDFFEKKSPVPEPTEKVDIGTELERLATMFGGGNDDD